jgi:hypothetical protein
MNTIWKFPVLGHALAIEMPRGAEILTVQMHNDSPVLWAKVDTTKPIELRYVDYYGTGHEIPDYHQTERKYIGTIQTSDGLVFHVFELLKPPTP